MTREEAGELAKILQAFSKSKPLQYTKDAELNTWLDYDYDNDTDVLYSIVNMGIEFRIKPERKKEPLTMQDLIERRKLGYEFMLVNHKEFDGEHLITDIMDDGVCVKSTYYKYSDLMAYYTFLNNDPCYKEVDCENI